MDVVFALILLSKEVGPHQLMNIFHNFGHDNCIFGIPWSEDEKQNHKEAYNSVGRIEVDEFKQVA